MAGKKRAAAKPAAPSKGYYVYIGPDIKNVIVHGTVYRGTRADALAEAKDAIAKNALVSTLIVSGDSLTASAAKAKTPGTGLYEAYQRIKKEVN